MLDNDPNKDDYFLCDYSVTCNVGAGGNCQTFPTPSNLRSLQVQISSCVLLTITLGASPVTGEFHAFTQHKKASNHHANLPLEMYNFTL